ncbi:MAG: GLPGLI family protein [Flavobacterium sp.]
MKIIYISILLLCSVVYPQSSGTVSYSFHTANILEDIKNPQTKDFAKKIVDIANQQVFNLTFNKTKTQFVQVESLTPVSDFDQKLGNVARSGFTSHDIFSDFANGRQLEIMSDGTLVESKYEDLKWEITSDAKEIGGYLCYKAILKIPFINRYGEAKVKEVIAYFAPSLPYSFGPKEFYGLPGLILELIENHKTFVVSKIKLSDQDLKIDFPKGKTISKEEYIKRLESSMGAVILSKKREKEDRKN